MTAVGSGKHTYTVNKDWFALPEGWQLGWIPAVACDSQDRVYVYSRSARPMIVFDRAGQFIASWGEEVLEDAHGIFIDAEDQVWCIERDTHCVHKFTCDGELLLTLGTPKQQGAVGEPFRLPTDLTLDDDGFIYVCDGYDNACIHKYDPDGQFIKTWGSPGSGSGEFDLPHCVRFDGRGRLMVADRANNRIQFFDTDGNYLEEWGGFNHPDTIFLDGETVYVAELDQRVSIVTLDGERLAAWGSGARIDEPGEFLGCPHGIWMDSRGDLYVGEVQTNSRLQKFELQG
jgi:sugar lactone lactonase YvrE